MIRYRPLPLTWYPARIIGDPFATGVDAGSRIEKRLAAILKGHDRVPFSEMRCAEFVASVLDSLYREPRELLSMRMVPTDIGTHDRGSAQEAMRWFMSRYPNHRKVQNRMVEPGDLIIAGPEDGGPGHALIVGPLENTLWHTTPDHYVHQTGWSLPEPYKFYAAYRFTDREVWA